VIRARCVCVDVRDIRQVGRGTVDNAEQSLEPGCSKVINEKKAGPVLGNPTYVHQSSPVFLTYLGRPFLDVFFLPGRPTKLIHIIALDACCRPVHIRRQRVPTAFSPLLIFPRTTSSAQPTLLGGPGEQTYHHPAVPHCRDVTDQYVRPFHANYSFITNHQIFYFSF
jgi:hypothetical protein